MAKTQTVKGLREEFIALFAKNTTLTLAVRISKTDSVFGCLDWLINYNFLLYRRQVSGTVFPPSFILISF